MVDTIGLVTLRAVRPATTSSALWTWLAVALPALAALAASMSTIDLAYQVRAGEIMIDGGTVLRNDPFTFTVLGQPWLDQQWLAQVAFALVYRVGGWQLMAIAHAILVAAAFGFLVATLRSRGLTAHLASGISLAVFLVSLGALGMRPQLLGIVCLAALLWALAHGGRAVWLVPIITLAWANVHGSFVLAPILVGLAWLEAALPLPGTTRRSSPRMLLVVAALAVVATVVTPFGLDVWRYALGLATSAQVSRLVTEWQRTAPTTYGGALFYVSLLAVAGLAWRVRRHLGMAALVGLAGFAAFGIYAERGTVWWAFVSPWLLAPALLSGWPRAGREAPERARQGNLVLAGFVALLGMAVMPWPYRAVGSGVLPLLADAPVALSDRLSLAVPPGAHVAVAQPWASWSELASQDRLVLVDARFELFPDSIWSDYVTLSAGGPGTRAILDRWQVDAALVSATAQPGLLRALQAMPDWRLVFEDPDGGLWIRSGP